MRKFSKLIILILVIFSITNIFYGCMDSKKNNKEFLNILIEEPKEVDEEFISTIIEEYGKENKNLKIKTEFSKDIEESKKILINNKFDLIFCCRNSMIEFSRKGLLKDIGNVYESNDVNSRFYNIICSYGRYNNTYYGIGLMPYSLSLLVNKNLIGENLDKKEGLEVNEILDITSKYNNEISVILPKNMDLSLALGAFISNNMIMDNKLEENFSDNKLKYGKIQEIENSFKTMDDVIRKLKNNKINFVEIGEKSIEDIKNGKVPIALTTSLVFKNINQDKNFKIVSKILDNKYKISPVIIIDHNICALQNANNQNQVNKFLNFICKDDIYIKLAQKGYASGNSLASTYGEGMQKETVWITSLANENNIPFYFNLPNDVKIGVLKEFKNIMDYKYDSEEWNRILNKDI